MSIAIFGISSIYNGIQKFMNASAHLQSFDSQITAHAPYARAPQQRALRVVRIAEHGDSSHAAGRMVISGRMADVCAELDRLVALEAKNKASLPH
jgi:hypothetical protein